MPTVARFAHAPEAYLFQATLAAEDIESDVVGAESMAWTPGSTSLNAIRLEVAEEDFARAREIHSAWQKERVAQFEADLRADEALVLPAAGIVFRWLVLAYGLLVIPLGFVNRHAYEREAYGAAAGYHAHGAWSLSHDGYPGYLACSAAAAMLLFFFSRWGRWLLHGTLVWWLLASVLRIGGARVVVSWPAEIVVFAVGVAIAVLMHRPALDPLFYPSMRRKGSAETTTDTEGTD